MRALVTLGRLFHLGKEYFLHVAGGGVDANGT